MLTILLVSTADTELLAAAASGAAYLTANPARLTADEVPALAARADLVVLRLLGGRQAWPEGVRRALPERLSGRGWGLGVGFLAGLVGGAVGTPGPPVIIYATTQGWSPRTMKANIMGFFVLNQGAILIGYWWAGLLTASVLTLTLAYALPALAGVGAGMALFGRLDPVRFRRVVFALLLVSGLMLLIRG